MIAVDLPRPADVERLDAATMRAIAAVLDERAAKLRRCPCLPHNTAAAADEVAAGALRSWAFSARGGAAVPG